ncbi:hypothetical protein AKJ57_04580 [candidate division MSBL1 archaeon SCGC-AAA259A05]|uniref:Uncharacterized protein n=1 Tax=candidate division MSBL1 archaeon SCGC-AAA259A05 TaxID=1698259 RepID=A0A133U761_9EURY|nr:hypothetical protein AKJ57_04580 [candidate division MSBL1 archaeon SCGC-AAA259A05]
MNCLIIEIEGETLGKLSGGIILLLGFGILAAGACVLLKTEESTATWYYHKGNEVLGDIPGIGDFLQEGLGALTESPAEGDAIAKIGYKVIGIHHRIGIFDVAEADSWDEAKSIASNVGLVTSGFGVLLLLVGSLVVSSGEKETVVVKEKSR